MNSGVAILFDLDGVLIDTREATRTALHRHATNVLGRAVDAVDVDRVVALPLGEALAALGVTDPGSAYPRSLR